MVEPNSSESNDLEPGETIDPEKVRMVFDSVEKKAAEAQDLANQAAQYAGHTREVIRVAAPFYIQLAQLAQDSPQLQPIVASGIQFVKSLDQELEQSTFHAASLARGLYSMSSSSDTFMSTSGSVASVIFPGNLEIQSYEPPPFFVPTETDVERKLAAIDPSLADTYREIGQAYHGTTADPARAAIALMRQVFDHFFARLAPDDAVRNSPYWCAKKGADPDQITRRERMTYAAYTHIRDKARADTIVANITHILDTYQMLNKLHTRGALSEQQARSAIKTMKKFLETWTDALDYPANDDASQ